MRIAQINLPKLSNDGASLAKVHADLQRNLCTIFDGFTAWDAKGAWENDGKVYLEDVVVYQIAYVSHPPALTNIRALAKRAGRDAAQIAMFVVIDGEAEIITI